jgi:hypothetical protein
MFDREVCMWMSSGQFINNYVAEQSIQVGLGILLPGSAMTHL